MERLKHIIQVNIVLGAWLIAAPFVLGYAGARLEMSNDVALGVLLIAFSWWMLAAPSSQVVIGVLQIVCGLWLIVAPFVLRYGPLSRPYTNDTLVGILSVLAGVASTWMLSARQKTAA
jgi:hypothetical protein